jgi:glycosyltransferase involved in cell wall biosynthesis
MPLPRPFVSVVVPVLNEEAHLKACLESAQNQTYPPDLMEILVADGGSVDRSREIVDELAAFDPRIRLIHNPRQNQAAGLNLAIASSRGDLIARLDGHAEWPADHLERCAQLLQETGADNVGGTMRGIGGSALERAIAGATRSPFAVGGATYRYSNRQQEVQTVWLGCFRRSALDRVGPFDESAPPHEDYELNHRIRASGGTVIYSPSLATTYWPRSSWGALISQYFRYGRSKVRVAVKTPGVLNPYNLAPPSLVGAAVAGAVALIRPGRGRRLTMATAGAYVATCLVACLLVSRGQPTSVRSRTVLVFPVIHLSWGVGFWAGIAEMLAVKPPPLTSVGPSAAAQRKNRENGARQD